MNSDLVPDYFQAGEALIFSTNSPTKGENFDLDARAISLFQSKETGNLSFAVGSVVGQDDLIRNQLFEIHSDSEERGPYSAGFSDGVFTDFFQGPAVQRPRYFSTSLRKRGHLLIDQKIIRFPSWKRGPNKGIPVFMGEITGKEMILYRIESLKP